MNKNHKIIYGFTAIIGLLLLIASFILCNSYLFWLSIGILGGDWLFWSDEKSSDDSGSWGIGFYP